MYLRESILANIATTLRGITVAAGYQTNVRKVTRKFKDVSEITEFATCCVLASDSPLRHLDSNEQFEADLGFTIIGYVRTAKDISDSGALSMAVESLIGDTIKALYADFHRGDTENVDETVIEQIEPYYDWEKNIGVMVISGHVLYHTDFSNP
jgi:hypothetical protein